MQVPRNRELLDVSQGRAFSARHLFIWGKSCGLSLATFSRVLMGSDEGWALRVSNGFWTIGRCLEAGGKGEVFAHTKNQNHIGDLFYLFKFPSHLTSQMHRLSMVKRRWRQLAGEPSETFSSPDGATVTSCRSARATTLSEGNLRRRPCLTWQPHVLFWEQESESGSSEGFHEVPKQQIFWSGDHQWFRSFLRPTRSTKVRKKTLGLNDSK